MIGGGRRQIVGGHREQIAVILEFDHDVNVVSSNHGKRGSDFDAMITRIGKGVIQTLP